MVRRPTASCLLPTHYLRTADTIVKVPEMAESITEGTLKQFSKRKASRFVITTSYLSCSTEVGDFVERDEEIATIETDKVRFLPQRPCLAE
jgi:2-oxoglutarate dehydrogenase E2 component (dihydrolipoamide succinyltransferase)